MLAALKLVAAIVPVPEAARLAPVPTNIAAVVLVPLAIELNSGAPPAGAEQAPLPLR